MYLIICSCSYNFYILTYIYIIHIHITYTYIAILNLILFFNLFIFYLLFQNTTFFSVYVYINTETIYICRVGWIGWMLYWMIVYENLKLDRARLIGCFCFSESRVGLLSTRRYSTSGAYNLDTTVLIGCFCFSESLQQSWSAIYPQVFYLRRL